MDFKIIAFFIYQFSLATLSIILILDIVRLSVFLFYGKKETHLSKKLMIKPVVGTKIYSWQNILVVCFLVPSFYLVRMVGVRLNIFVFYGLAILMFFLFTSIAFLHKKIQSEIENRKKAKMIFLLEIGILILLGIFHFSLNLGTDIIEN